MKTSKLLKGENWDEFYQSHGRFYLLPHPALNGFIENLGNPEGKRVLDLGCGSGRNLVALSEAGYDVEGVDFSPISVKMANEWLRSKNLSGRAVVADIHEKLSIYQNAEFDGIIAVNSLNFQSSDNFLDSIKEINRLLRPGGIALIVLPTKESIIEKPNIEQFFINEKSLAVAFKGHLDIIVMHMDDDKNIVAICKETKIPIKS